MRRWTQVGMVLILALGVLESAVASTPDPDDAIGVSLRIGGDLLLLPVIHTTTIIEGAARLDDWSFSAAAESPVLDPLHVRLSGTLNLSRESLSLGMRANTDFALGESGFALVAAASPPPRLLASDPAAVLVGVRAEGTVTDLFNARNVVGHRVVLSPHGTLVFDVEEALLLSLAGGVEMSLGSSDPTVSCAPYVETVLAVEGLEVGASARFDVCPAGPVSAGVFLDLVDLGVGVGASVLFPASGDEIALSVHLGITFGDPQLLGERARLSEGLVICSGDTCILIGR